jgi:hypothetical protein
MHIIHICTTVVKSCKVGALSHLEAYDCHTRFSKEQNQANHICAQEVHTYVRMEKYQKQ